MKTLINICLFCLFFSSNYYVSGSLQEKQWLFCSTIQDTCFIPLHNNIDENINNWLKEINIIDSLLISKNISYETIHNEFEIAGYTVYKGDRFVIKLNDNYEDLFTIQVTNSKVLEKENYSLGEFIYHKKYGIIIAVGEYRRLYLKKIIVNCHDKKEVIVYTEELVKEVISHEYFEIDAPPLPKKQ